MPASNPQHIPTVIHFVSALSPERILDVGVGNGAYGFLLRQYMDIGQQRIDRSQWRVCIEGIEIYVGYRNAVWDFAYDRIYIGDARKMLDALGRYDVILFNDVLEHVRREEARSLVKQAMRHAKAVIATTPNIDYPQGAFGDNDAEKHLCRLDASDFDHLVAQKQTGITTCYVCSADDATRAHIRDAAITCPICKIDSISFWFGRVCHKAKSLMSKRSRESCHE